MSARLYELSAEAQRDLVDIWRKIAFDSVDLADRIEDELHALFASLARMPGLGYTRKDLTKRPVLFFPLYSFLIIYQPDIAPLRIIAVVRGKRHIGRLLKTRS